MHVVPVTRLLSLPPFSTRLDVTRSARSLYSVAKYSICITRYCACARFRSSKVNDGSGITMRQRQEMSRLAVRLSVRVSEHTLIIEALVELL